ncbi:hypothetical protein ABS71_05505 [bacterium SCN 62-11]|nr:hypothetical protein [Candidatus Eremiobacteraeota bacterium]ODT74564.1 MAG: hypothetical protein ABS71_05505 [bacterium SCN 62-11]
MIDASAPMALHEVLGRLDLTPGEAEGLLRDAKIPADREQLAIADLTRVNVAWSVSATSWPVATGAARTEPTASTMATAWATMTCSTVNRGTPELEDLWRNASLV